MVPSLRPSSRDDFEIAIICALRVERDAVEGLLDDEYETDGFSYGKAVEDPNAYTTGRLGNQHVVLAYMPNMGKASAAAVTSNIRHSFQSIKLGLIVGICGGIPKTPELTEILLGDVIISTSVIQIDFGRQYPNGFMRKRELEDTLGRANPEIRSFVERASGYLVRERLKEKINIFSTQLCARNGFQTSLYPGPENDKLYPSAYRHKHQKPDSCAVCSRCRDQEDPVCESAMKSSCTDLGCDEMLLVRRDRIKAAKGVRIDGSSTPNEADIKNTQKAMIHFGRIASGDTVMKSGWHRDKIKDCENVIGFDMESAGALDCIPTVVIKGVCDYSDSHKTKRWQKYAAATAAACAKAILEEWRTSDKPYSGDTLFLVLFLFGSIKMYPVDQNGTDLILQGRKRKRQQSPDKQNPQLDKLPNVAQAAFNSYEKRHESVCLQYTRVEVLQEIRDWAHGRHDRPIFWLNGLAGTGKSTIARTVARENDEAGYLGASFFFSRGGGDLAHAGKFFPTIAVQLSNRIQSLKVPLSESLAAHDDVASQSLDDQWHHLILKPLKSLDNSFHQSRLIIVIDALDECEGDNDIRALLRLFSQIRDITTIQVRIFITSRPDTPLRLGFRQIPIICHHDLVLDEVSRELVDRDILIFFKNQFSEIRDIFEVAHNWPTEQTLNLLVSKSEGLFIYAATVCRFLKGNSDWSPEDLLKVFISNAQDNKSRNRGFPQRAAFAELDKMYTQILDYSLEHIEDPQDRAYIANEMRNIVSAIATLSQPLTTIALGRFLDIECSAIRRRLRHLRSVIKVPDEDNSPIILFHPSFRDFLFDSRRCTRQQFFIIEREAHERLARQCASVLSNNLKHDICNVKRYGIRVSEVNISTIQECLPSEVQYACIYWAQHVLKSGPTFSDDHWVYEFLRQYVLYWLEALSWMGRLSDGIHAIIALESSVSKKESPSILRLVHDARRFTLYCRSAIEHAPLQIYTSGLIFAPKSSVVRRQFENQIPQLMERLPEVEEAWNTTLQTLEGHSNSVNAVAFSPDGSVLASASSDGTFKLWDTRSGQERQTLTGHSGRIGTAVVFSLDGSIVASASLSPSPSLLLSAPALVSTLYELWDARSGCKYRTPIEHTEHTEHTEHLNWVNAVNSASAVAFSPGGSIVASASYTTVKLWDIRSGRHCQTLTGHSNWVNAVAFSYDGSIVASASYKTVKLWDACSGQERQTLTGHSAQVNAVAFSPDGSIVATASDDSTVKLWDTRSEQDRQAITGHSGRVSAVVFSPGGSIVASASDTTVTLWDIRSGQDRQTLTGHSDWVKAVAFSPDGSIVASASRDSTVKLWDAWSGQERETLIGHLDQVNAVAFSPDSSIVASASDDCTVKLWDAWSGQERRTLTGHSDWINAVAFSPDGSIVASASDDSTIKLWDALSGQEHETLIGHSDWINAVAFSPDGSVIALASDDSIIKLWDTRLGKECQTLKGHSDRVSAVAISPDGSVVASASYDNTVKLWDARSGQERQTLSIGVTLQELCFTREGNHILTDRGVVDTKPSPFISAPARLTPLPVLFVEEQWIKLGSESLLWLPHDYRPTCVAVRGTTCVLGHSSGRVTILQFTA